MEQSSPLISDQQGLDNSFPDLPSSRRRTQRSSDVVVPLLWLTVGATVVTAATLGIWKIAHGSSGRRQRGCVSVEEWRNSFDSQGRLTMSFRKLLDKIVQRGIAPELRHEVWPFLLKVFSLSTTEDQRNKQRKEMQKNYEESMQQCKRYEEKLQQSSVHRRWNAVAVGKNGQTRGPPLDPKIVQYAEAQRIICTDVIRTRGVRTGSIEYNSGSSSSGTNGASRPRDQTRMTRGSSNEKFSRDDNWESAVARETLKSAPGINDEASRTRAMRLVNILMSYAVYDPLTGYDQAMADLAMPFVLIFDSDYLAAACFKAYMQQIRENFSSDQTGLLRQYERLQVILDNQKDQTLGHHIRKVGAHNQSLGNMHFAHRMVAVQLRREFGLDSCLHLWEAMWADRYILELAQQTNGHNKTRRHSSENGSSNSLSTTGTTTGAVTDHELTQLLTTLGADSSAPRLPQSLFLYYIAAVCVRMRRTILDNCHSYEELKIEVSNYKKYGNMRSTDIVAMACDIRRQMFTKRSGLASGGSAGQN